MASYLGFSDYRPITPQHNFALPSHFDQHEDQCYEKPTRDGGGHGGRGRPGVNPTTGRSLLDTTSHAYDVEKAERVDLLLPVRHTSELNFHGYFVDDLAAHEQVVRPCNVTLFLEDGTLRVYEPRTPNSGYAQGEFLKRSLVLNPATRRPFAPADFRIGEAVHVCGHRIVVTDADGLTRQQLDLGPPTPVPKGRGQWPYSSSSSAAHRSPVSVVDGGAMAASSPGYYGRKSTLVLPAGEAARGPWGGAVTNFLAHDRQVLRFFGVWRADPRAPDARAADRNVSVLFYLVDGSVEIVEGRSREDSLTKRVLSRQRVIKTGRQRPNCIVHGDGDKYYRRHHHPHQQQHDGDAYVGPADLQCGAEVDLFGKAVALQSTDEFTRAWYARHHPGMRQVLPRVYDAPAAAQWPTPADHFNGYGASVDERFAHPDDDDGTDDAVVLRFEARLFAPERDPRQLRFGAPTTLLDMQDAERRFVVSFFPGDSSCMLVELPSAVAEGGTFLRRARYRYHETGRRAAAGTAGSTSTNTSSAGPAPATTAPGTGTTTLVAARRFRATDFSPGAVVSFESEPLSGSRLPERNIPAGPASARFVIGAADAFSVEYVRKEAVRRTHRLQATLDCLRAHFLGRPGMTPAWVRGQMRHLGRPRISKAELRRALDSLALHPQAFPASSLGGLPAAIELLFDEYGEVDRELGAVMHFDDLIDDLVRAPAAPPPTATEAAGAARGAGSGGADQDGHQQQRVVAAAPELLVRLETVPALRPRLRACDTAGCGHVGLLDVQVVLRQAGVVAPQAVVMQALRDFAAHDGTRRVRYDALCDACTPGQWAAPLRRPDAARGENQQRRGYPHGSRAVREATAGGVAPPSSIAAIAGLGEYPDRHRRSSGGASFQPPPEHHFYQSPDRRCEDPALKAMRSRMLGSAGVSEVMMTTPRR